jgi:mono/diheme cytochrome c family protein
MRNPSCGAAFAVLVCAAAAASAQTSQQGNPREGRRLAQNLCETCHVVAANQELKPLVPNYAPSFSDVADRPGTSAASTETFLLHQHPLGNMPFPDLTDAQAADLARYIMSLKSRR